jgi:hypothetical protein
VKKVTAPARKIRVATILGLVTTSLACLCVGALAAVAHEGLSRILFAGAGFWGYLYFFAHALRGLALPAVLIHSQPGPDGEVRREEARPRKAGRQNGALRVAA